ncbi:MAG TPA: carboxypeptidase regulatory-like domain-containing protein [Pyrinomonadaceae bacterium]|nr:carboxypeptidase regulatory-like domain-containing protein [Pyrinomonadaceae bacterium]
MFGKILLVVVCLLGCASINVAQQRAGSLRGQVSDELGALVVGATVTLVAADGTQKNATTNDDGVYTFNGVAPGAYTLRVVSPGFSPYEKTDLAIVAGPRTTHDVRLVVTLEKQVITVTEEQALNTDPANNADAVVLRGQDLDVLPDDPDALSAAVSAMAGPSAGPSGGQIFIDGFTGGRMPPKESIREVRVNQNPFNAENSGVGFGNIEIFTKPGADKLRGSTFFNFNDESFNSRNPFAPNRAPFQVRYFGGSISGPITKGKSSFFIDFQKREIDDNAIINATILNSNLVPGPFNVALITPQRFFSFSPRFDYQLNQGNTLVLRYSYTRTRADNVGASDFSLPERAFSRSNTFQTFQATETAIISPTLMNETRFQYQRNRAQQDGNNSIPTVVVQEAFIAGGSQIGLAHNDEDRWELQNYSTWTKGRHVLRFGGRVRGVNISDFSPQNFGGTFTFSGGEAPQLDANNQIVRDANNNPVLIPITSLERYRRTLLFQNNPDMRLLGGGATQFSIAGGNPEASVRQIDLGAFVQDEWRVRPNLTFTAGFRYERQTNISSNYNFAPRLFFAWAPGGTNVGGNPGAPSSSSPKMVIRGGMGVFYDRFSERATLLANRFDGTNQLDFRVFDPERLDEAVFSLNGVTNVPTADSLAAFAAPQIVRRIAPDFQAPTFVMTAINFERQLPSKFTMFLVAFNYRGKHLLRVRNINAPLPGTYDPANPDTSVRPFGNIGDIYYYESSAKFNDYRFFGGVRRQMSKGFSLFANFGTGKGKTDTDCIFGSIGSCFPADSYDASSEYSRVSFIPSANFFFGGTFILPRLKVNLNPFVVYSSGRPFNIITGQDTNGDGLFTERPAFATAQTDPNDLKRTRFGDFDLHPDPGQPLIPRNYGLGPSFFSVNIGISRAFMFGNVPASSAAAPSPSLAGAAPAGGAAKPANAPAPEKRYTLTFSMNIQNLLNTTNLSNPIGNLSSPRFGESTSVSGGFGFGPSGSSAAGNRRIQLQVRFGF